MSSSKNEKDTKTLKAVLVLVVVAIGVVEIGVPALTDETSDASRPNFTHEWYWGGTVLGTWHDNHLHVFPGYDHYDQGIPDGYMPDGKVMTTTVYSLNNLANGKIDPYDSRTTMIYRSMSDFKCTWKNYDGTVLSTVEHISASQDPAYNGLTPVHPDGRAFLGWTTYLDDTGNPVKTALFQDVPTDDTDDNDDIYVEKTSFFSKIRTFMGDVFGKVKDVIQSLFPRIVLNGQAN